MPVIGRALRLLCMQGVLAANIFDWGAKACVDMYHNATILEMYREVGATLVPLLALSSTSPAKHV